MNEIEFNKSCSEIISFKKIYYIRFVVLGDNIYSVKSLSSRVLGLILKY